MRDGEKWSEQLERFISEKVREINFSYQNKHLSEKKIDILWETN